jgi:hypothetical protein
MRRHPTRLMRHEAGRKGAKGPRQRARDRGAVYLRAEFCCKVTPSFPQFTT